MAANDDDLDKLLDSALDDLINLDIASSQRTGADVAESGDVAASSSNSMTPVQGLGMGLPDLKAKKGKKRAGKVPEKGAHAAEALEMLMKQTRETVRGIENSPGVGEGEFDEAMVEEFVKQFQEAAGSQNMESIVETMMQQLLSKEILQEPMKEIGERYPQWLEEHKKDLSSEDYDRYHRQYGLILKLNEVYENEPDNFQKIVDLMQKMQECGQPPSDIVQELAPDLDLNNLAQLSPELLNETASNCCVM